MRHAYPGGQNGKKVICDVMMGSDDKMMSYTINTWV